MGNSEAAGNIVRINALIATNDEYRAEAKSSIADIEKARGQAATAGGIAEKLALGTDEAIQEVVDAAGPALEEFEADLNAATASRDALFASVEKLNSKINSLNNKATLTDKEIEN
jgi:flagellar biosynthesis/type III secretory pathway protein FliH